MAYNLYCFAINLSSDAKYKEGMCVYGYNDIKLCFSPLHGGILIAAIITRQTRLSGVGR